MNPVQPADKSTGKWYRSFHPRYRILYPDNKYVRKRIQEMRALPVKLDESEWESIPFRSPIHASLDYIYTVDQDAGYLIISFWKVVDGKLAPGSIQVNLERLYGCDEIDIMGCFPQLEQSGETDKPETMELSRNNHKAHEIQIKSMTNETRTLRMDFGLPSPMNELQAQFFIDLVFLWRFYIDDPLTWKFTSPVFRTLCIAFLRLAAYDFEIAGAGNVASELPISSSSIPSWDYPESDSFWFHGYLILLQEDIISDAAVNRAILEAKSHMQSTKLTRLILLSPQHVAFAEYSNYSVVVSQSLTLLSDTSGMQCSPGFRALSRVFTPGCWRTFSLNGETSLLSQVGVPSEILQMIIHELTTRDIVSFAQASFAAETFYYSSVGQLKHTTVDRFQLLITCCGERAGLRESGICCTQCYSWYHTQCIGLEEMVDHYICTAYRQITTELKPGGVHWFSRRKKRNGSKLIFRGSPKSLKVRLAKPAYLRPELRLIGNLWQVPPGQIDYSILFNGSFSGLAYGMEDR
ncbi:hypothetical protein N7540_000069 [Penicillium herquei]|nr:hypothetical protein N7540_000069 [Penicillium herquei]